MVEVKACSQTGSTVCDNANFPCLLIVLIFSADILIGLHLERNLLGMLSMVHSGFSIGTGSLLTVNTNPYKLTGLQPLTSYDYYIGSNCGSSTSTWSGPYTFTTLEACPAPQNLLANNTNGVSTL